MIYCRFVLHHLSHPTEVIQKIFDLLPKGGIFIAEEGIVSAAFSYPPVSGWGQERLKYPLPNESEEHRDGNFGMKLFHQMKKVGFNIKHAGLYQPLLYLKEQKDLLAGPAREGYKQYALDHGMNQDEWKRDMKELDGLIENPAGCLGFYQSCLVVGTK